MIEILWYGRGGQGAFTAAKIIGTSWVLKDNNNYALAFPSFGPERRGAPMRAFTKLDKKPIHDREEIKKSDYIVYLDDTLFDESVLESLKPNGKVILNTRHHYSHPQIITADASLIAKKILKRPITNTAMLGVLSAVCPDIAFEDIEEGIIQNMPVKLAGNNILAARAAKEVLA